MFLTPSYHAVIICFNRSIYPVLFCSSVFLSDFYGTSDDSFLFAEVGKLYGGGLKYWPVWNRMKQINIHAQALRAAYDAGKDPIDVELDCGPTGTGKSTKGTQSLDHPQTVWRGFFLVVLAHVYL